MNYLASWLYDSKSNFEQQEDVRFFIHDKEHLVKANVYPPTMTLNEYLRKVVNLTGTKNMCLEGGCGACMVAVSFPDPLTKNEVLISVNSCLVLIYSCSGWKIYTAEGIGNSQIGIHPIQKAMVENNGTQCGFCTSGMVMNMYALYESKETLTQKELEGSFGGNICRCTGYRPILTAFKTLVRDDSNNDIEDIPRCFTENCTTTCKEPCGQRSGYYLQYGKCQWYKAYSINEVLDIIQSNLGRTYMLVGGNTASGVYKDEKPVDVYIDITEVKNLLIHGIYDNQLVLGANMTLTNVMNLFRQLSEQHPGFSYLKKMVDHIDLVAHVAVRNIGTLAGNLFTKHQHREFPSDIFLMLETVGAKLTLINTARQEIVTSPKDFLDTNMDGTIIKSIALPPLGQNYRYESYKIMPLAQNAVAMVNAGFLVKLDSQERVQKIRIVYGGINPSFVHADVAESYLIGKKLFQNKTLQGVYAILNDELIPNHVLPDPSPIFRKKLAIALFYKFILSIAPDDKVSQSHKSGATRLTRPVSTGSQEYGTNPSTYPVSQPIHKLEALAQSTGKAEYILDMPDRPEQLYAAFVVVRAPANSVLRKVDTIEAMRMKGVVAYFDKNDIPGVNSFTPPRTGIFINHDEEMFCSGTVRYYSQPVGILVATTQAIAEKAADMVKITYVPGEKKPLLTVKEILNSNDTSKVIMDGEIEAKSRGTDIQHVVKANFNIGWQYHYHMETQCCVVVPNEDGLDVYASTQHMNLTQTAAAKLLNLPVNKINVVVRRLGGAYGAKLFRNSLVSSATALAGYKLQKPVKFYMTMESNMDIIGKRFPLYGEYEVGVNNNGVIQYLDAKTYSDYGNQGGNEHVESLILDTFPKCYNSDTFGLKVYSTRSDNPTGSATRAPGTLETIAFLENIMQSVSVSIGMDPITFRLNNISSEPVRKILNDLLQWADVRNRQAEVAKFNKENRWKKKGIAVVPMAYPLNLLGPFHVHVSIFQGDGSVAITHGGIEMGQGINTKVAQVCAYTLKIPLELVSIKPSQSVVCPNDLFSGFSFSSECVCLATLKACEILNERIKPIRDGMKEPVDWAELIWQCFLANVDLCGSFMYYNTLPELQNYVIYGATCVEVELDVLTGQQLIKRADVIEDTGDSLSPYIDIGQIEGGFVMGLGYWTSEEIVYDADGKLYTNRTWNYKVPGAKDIPIDFRIKFPKNNPNRVGVLNSKATAEPPTCMAIAIALAIKDAVASARTDSSSSAKKWYPIDGPCTVESNFLNSLNDFRQYTL